MFIPLFVILFLTLTYAHEWLEFGGSYNASHHVPNGTNIGYKWTNTNLTLGQDQEIMVGNFVGDSLKEALIWNSSDYRLFLINLTSASVIRRYDIINSTLLGQPTVFKNKYYAVVKNNIDSNSYFYEIKFNESTHNVSFNFSFGTEIYGKQAGVRCATANGTDYCLFMDNNNTIYRVDVSNRTYTAFNNILLAPFLSKVVKKVPAIADLHQDGGLDAVFTYIRNDSTANVIVYDIAANATNNGFSNNGHETINTGLNVIPPFIHKYNNLDGRLDITFTVETNNPFLFVYDANGSRILQKGTSNNRDFTTLPVLSRCNFAGTPELPQEPALSVQFATGEGSGSFPGSSYEMSWMSPLLNESSHTENVLGVSEDSFIKSAQSMVAADFNGDGLSELLLTISRYENGAVTNSIINCSNSTHILYNLTGIEYPSPGRFHQVVVDFNEDGLLDIVSTITGKTMIFSTAPSADLQILEVIPIQVVKDVTMVKDKSGIVRVVVRNNGPLNANATVNATLDGSLLSIYPEDSVTKSINVSKNQTFDFSFKPTETGTRSIKAEVKVG